MTLSQVIILWFFNLFAPNVEPCSRGQAVEQEQTDARDTRAGWSAARCSSEGDDDDDIYNGF